jgi:hypothetical protein
VPDVVNNISVVKLSNWLPEIITKGIIMNMGLKTAIKNANGYQEFPSFETSEDIKYIISPEEAGDPGIWSLDSTLALVENPDEINSALGTSYFTRGIYLASDVVAFIIDSCKAGYLDYYDFIVPISGTKIENVSFNPVTVDVYVPPTSDEELEITGPEAGSTVTHEDDGTYYNKIKVTSLPTQTVDVELKETA